MRTVSTRRSSAACCSRWRCANPRHASAPGSGPGNLPAAANRGQRRGRPGTSVRIRRHTGRGGRRHGGSRPRRGRFRVGAPGCAQPVPRTRVRKARPAGQRAVRRRLRRGGHRPRTRSPTDSSEAGDRRFSLCLQGPPGTGKSAYARHLADRLDSGGPAKARLGPAEHVRPVAPRPTSQTHSPKHATRARSWSSTRPTPSSPTVAAHTASGRSAKSTRC